jgi:hypothetical protein
MTWSIYCDFKLGRSGPFKLIVSGEIDKDQLLIMDVWESQSNSGKQTVLLTACAITGLVLMVGFRDFGGFRSNSMAGFLLGVLLFIIGVAGFLVSGRQAVVVDPNARCITIEDSNRFRTKKRRILFSDIVDTGIGYLGRKSNYVTFYYIILKLRNGEEYPLFSPGRFFEGGSDRSVMESRRQRLEEYLKQHVG